MTNCRELERILESLAEPDREQAIEIVAEWSVLLDQCLARWIDRRLFDRSFLCGAFAVGIARHRFEAHWPRESFRSLVAVAASLDDPAEGVVVTLISDLELLAGRDALDDVLPLVDVLRLCLSGLASSDLAAVETLSLLTEDGFGRFVSKKDGLPDMSSQSFDSLGALEDQKQAWASLLALRIAELES